MIDSDNPALTLLPKPSVIPWQSILSQKKRLFEEENMRLLPNSLNYSEIKAKSGI